MDAQRQPHAAALDKAWEAVRRWPGLRGEDKLAWHFLWRESGQGRQQVDVNATMVAADQGTSTDAGRKRIKNLAAEGLIVVVDHKAGRWLVEIIEPLGIARARRLDFDGQLTFDFETNSDEQAATSAPHDGDIADCLTLHGAAEEPPEDPPVEPRRATLPSKSSSIAKTSPSLTSGSEEKLEVREGEGDERGNAGGSAVRMGGLLRELPSLAGQQRRAEELTDEILRRVDCVKMYRSAAAKVAAEIVEGLVPSRELTTLLAKLDSVRAAGKMDKTPSAYFNGAWKRIRSRHGA